MDYKKQIEGLKNNSYMDFKILYDAFSRNLFGFVYGLTKSESLSKDIVQETFIKVWVNRKNIQVDLSFKSYLFKISQNLIIDEFRKKMSNPVFENYLNYCDNIPAGDNETEQKMDFDLFVKRLEKAKSKLTPRQREIFEMNKEQGIPVSEIARLFNINEQTIYNQLSTAVRTLKKEIGTISLQLFVLFFS
jgi:RNA polymerase sigma-70 factor (ECF subfamily)